MMEFLVGTRFNFLGHRRAAFILSAVLIIAGAISLIVQGGPRLGIDFEGGTLVQVRFEKPIDVQEIRDSLADIGMADAEIQRFGENREAIIRAQQREEGEDLTGVILEALNEANPDNRADVRRQEQVGPTVGRELRAKATNAILIALVLILAYISIRFEFKFAVGAVAALVHDVAITLGLFSMTGREISLPVVAAFLTIVGYSLNDTIVIYDRIRENRRKLYGKSFTDIVNTSLNESLSRTVVTSLTTLVVVLCIFLFGGEVIKDFSFALLVGVVVGTYSSLYVASPLVVEWQVHGEARKRRRHRK
ncbi:MAG: protein translocase subunit SecF [Candidatus Eisenbacteria bacterium]|nr:protein translocase subunit SecF [Candidatus Eisenbacteria bacterium]